MKKFIENLSNIQTLQKSIGKSELKKLSVKLIDEYECKEDLENNLLLFFSLNAADVELILKHMRKKSIKQFDEDKIGGKFLEKNERLISEMVNRFNQISQKKSNKPFHLAAALGELEISEEILDSFKIDLRGLVRKDNGKMFKGAKCPEGSYPRYVGRVFPWRLRWSLSTTTKQRKEDVGCHFDHGPFDGTIRGWVSFSIQVIIMIILQGWGGRLAANKNHYFYKWWFVFMVGLTPYSCQLRLLARRY